MRSDGPLTARERELVFAYVSGLNRCNFCRDSHTVVLEHFGLTKKSIDDLIDRGRTEAVGEPMRVVLAYSKKFVVDPEVLVREDVEAVLEAGWDEGALVQVVWICGLAQCFNSLVHGLGIQSDPSLVRFGGEHIYAYGYAQLKSMLDAGE